MFRAHELNCKTKKYFYEPSFPVSCVSSAVKAGEAAAEEREDSLQGPLRVEQGEGRPTFSTGPQRQ